MLLAGGFTSAMLLWGNAQRRRLERATLEKLVVRVIAMCDEPVKYRRSMEEDSDLFRPLETIHAVDALFTRLGDAVVVHGVLRIAIRVYCDPSGEVLAYRMPIGKVPSLTLESYTASQELVTRSSDDAEAVVHDMRPESSHATDVPVSASIDDMLAEHRDLIRRHAIGSLVRLTTLDDAIRQFQIWHDRIREWRAIQDKHALLWSDLRKILGKERFAKEGEYWVKRLGGKRATLPVARVN